MQRQKKEMFEMRERIPGYEEQRVFGDRNATSEYVEAVRVEFEGCMRNIFLEIAKKAFNKEKNIAESVMDGAIDCWRRYFQSMNGGINLTEEDIKRAIRKEEERQKRFYDALIKLTKEFKGKGFQAEVIPPDKCYKDSYWDTALTAECNIKVNNAYLCAFPLIPAKTSDFLASQQPAANVILIDEDCVVLQPQDQTLGDEFWKANEEIFTEKDMKGDFPEAISAKLKNSFLLLISLETFSEAELEEMRKKYNVVSIVKGDLSNFSAFIYTGKLEEFYTL